MGKYALPSDAQVLRIAALFDIGEYDALCVSVSDEGYSVSVAAMYQAPEIEGGLSILQAMHEIAAILGCSDGCRESDIADQGCETCDYGSSYGWEWRFWRAV